MKNYKRLYIYLSLGLLSSIFFGVTSCEEGTITEDEYKIEYNRSSQLTNIYTNGILNIHQTFENEVSVLNENAKTFSQSISSENLIALQNQWKKTINIWKQCELYDIGDINDSFIHFRINRWPTNSGNIEEFISGTDVINKEFILLAGSSSKGISAIEYLLFDLDNESLLNLFENNTRRINYLVATSEVLKDDASELNTLWGSYGTTFINSTESGLEGGQNQLINVMVSLLEEIIQSKLGKSLGDTNGGITNIEELEAYRSDESLEMIKNNLIALEKCFNGNFEKDSRKFGFDNYLIELDNQLLVDAIISQFEICYDSIDRISSLNSGIENNPSLVEDLKQDFTDLLVLIKVDMSNFIGSTITFNDNDGD